MGNKTFLQGISLVLDDNGEAPSYSGEERYCNGSFSRKDSVGSYDPRTVWAAPHIAANVLPHIVDDWLGQNYYCVVEGQPFITKKTFWTDSTMLKKLALVSFQRDSAQRCTQLTTIVYKADGVTPSMQCVDTYSYTGSYVQTVVRNITSS